MAGKSQTIEVVISQLDWYIINRVKEIRKEKGMSQSELSVAMGYSDKYIGSVENPNLKAKYNISQLNRLAKALKCGLWELLPERPFDNDLVRIKLKRVARLSKEGKPTRKTDFEIVDMKPVTAQRSRQ